MTHKSEAGMTQLQLPTAIPEVREKTATALLNNFGMLQDGAITELGLRAIRTPVSSIPLALLLASAQSKAELPDLLLAALAWIDSGTEFLQKSKVAYDVMTLAADTLSKAANVPREVSFTLRQLREYRDSLESKEIPACAGMTSVGAGMTLEEDSAFSCPVMIWKLVAMPRWLTGMPA